MPDVFSDTINADRIKKICKSCNTKVSFPVLPLLLGYKSFSVPASPAQQSPASAATPVEATLPRSAPRRDPRWHPDKDELRRLLDSLATETRLQFVMTVCEVFPDEFLVCVVKKAKKERT